MKQAKENWTTDRCQEIDCGIRTGNSKMTFNTLKLLTQRQQTKTNLSENAKGKLLTEDKSNPESVDGILHGAVQLQTKN